MGTRRERYHCATELQAYSGIAPVLASSGKYRWVHWRWSCPKFLRQTFHEWATHSIRSSAWAKAYYEQQRAKGKAHHVIVRARAFKWIRVLFRCWKDRTPYSEEAYRQTLARRQHLIGPVQLQWKTCAGFSKIDLIRGAEFDGSASLRKDRSFRYNRINLDLRKQKQTHVFSTHTRPRRQVASPGIDQRANRARVSDLGAHSRRMENAVGVSAPHPGI